jgi:hypothetical protein
LGDVDVFLGEEAGIEVCEFEILEGRDEELQRSNRPSVYDGVVGESKK